MKTVLNCSPGFLLFGFFLICLALCNCSSGEYNLGQPAIIQTVDFNGDGIINFEDFSKLALHWLQEGSSVDIAQLPLGDKKVNFEDLAVLAEHWLQEHTIVYIQWLGHASIKIWAEDVVIYVDPRNLSISPHDATAVLVTHSHSDHYQPADIAKVSGPQTLFIAPPDVVSMYGKGQAIAPGQTIRFDGFDLTGVAAYNTNKPNHPKSNNWLGFVIEIASRRIYVAGDTDLIEEMRTLGDIDVAFLPVDGTYTMNPQEAAEAAKYIQPRLAIPYHMGTTSNAATFVELAQCNAKVMSVGEILSSLDWQKVFSLIAHWRLDEQSGSIAYDSANQNHGTVNGGPVWQPMTGRIDGAMEFDGIDDYIGTPFVLNPASGKFSVFAWVKAVSPGHVIISQAGGADWLSTEPLEGKLMTGLTPPAVRFAPQPLISNVIITDGQWHHLGFVWDGYRRILYVDDAEIARDIGPQAGLIGSTGGLYIGAGKTLDAAGFFSGMIDDVRIYNRAVVPSP